MAGEHCVLCGESIPIGSSYCPSCGALLPPKEETTDPLIGTVVADRYEIIALISSGGMGRVYRAEQKILERMVAIKIIDPRVMSVNQTAELTSRFMTEARAASRLNHPNVVSVFDFGRTSPAEHAPLFLAMELLTGPTLADVLASSEKRMPLARVADILRQTLAALGEAHHLGITHRDIKPANIILQKRQRGLADHVSVIDFGVARIGSERGMTERGRLLGTPHYMAPEAIMSSSAGASVDLYAVGVILFEMLTGRVPFDDPSAMTICLHHASAPRPDPRTFIPDLPDALAQVCFRALAVDPEARFPDAQALAEAISAGVSAPMTRRQTSVFPPRNPAKEAPTLPRAIDPVASLFPEERSSARLLARALPVTGSDATPLVARDDSLDWARELLGRPREVNAIVFWGKTGTGRSRLLREVSTAARERGTEVIERHVEWGPQNEVGYTCLRGLVARLAGFEVDDPRLVAGHAADERLVTTGLRELFGSPGTTLADEPGALRPAVAAAFTWAARRAAKSAGERLVLVVVDNVERIDGISRSLLWDFVRSDGPANLVFLLATEERPPAAREGATGSRMHDLEIVGLTRVDASALVSASRGAERDVAPESKTTARRLEPLYLEQYRRWRTERPRDRAPAGLREIIEARLQELEPAPRRALQALAVGGAITADQVAQLLERADGMDEAIRALVDAGFVVVTSSADGDANANGGALRSPLIRVVHSLYARVALDNAPAGVIDHLHARAAEILAASSADIERRAYHRIRTRPNLETFMLVERSVRLRTLRGDDEGAIAALSDGYFVARTYAARGDADANGWHVFGRKLAAALQRAGRTDQASGLLLEVLETLGPTDPARAPVLEDLAAIARMRGKTEEADRWQRQASMLPEESRPVASRIGRVSGTPRLLSQRPAKPKSGDFSSKPSSSRVPRARDRVDGRSEGEAEGAPKGRKR